MGTQNMQTEVEPNSDLSNECSSPQRVLPLGQFYQCLSQDMDVFS